ncbi:MAG: hypothetical protein NW223_01105 [Hyphomicrobiaceae bacterium]|nr:hypothetical protein [Hyphomicrobiaceae bacterium]
MSNTHRADKSDPVTEQVRQGTGPRETVSVLLVSLMMAAAAGIAIVAYFYLFR